MESEVTWFTIEFMLLHAARCEEVFRIARELLRPEHLLHDGETPHRFVWTALLGYYERYHERPGYQALSEQALSLAQSTPDPTETTVPLVNEILTFMYDRQINPDSELVPAVAIEKLRLILVDREVSAQLRRAVMQAGNRSLPGVETLLENTRRDLATIDSACRAQTLPVLGDGLESYYQRLERQRGRQLLGLRTGMTILDDRLCGLRGFCLLGAAPGVGKTVLALQIASGVCRHSAEGDNRACALYLSLDMDAAEVKDRLHCALAGMDWKTYRLGSPLLRQNAEGPRFTDAHQWRLDDARGKVATWQLDRRLAIVGRDQVGELTAARIAGMAQALKTRAQAEHCLIVVDYLQLLPVPERVARQGDLEADKYRVRIAQQALDASKGHDGQVQDTAIVVSEARKPATSTARHTWGVKVEDLMGSARLGYAADAVLLMRPMDKSDLESHYGMGSEEELRQQLEADGVSPLMLMLAKGRDGMTRGSWPAEFHYQESRISEGVPHRPSMDTPPRLGRGPRPVVDVSVLDPEERS
jgi:replicative DNA helicase